MMARAFPTLLAVPPIRRSDRPFKVASGAREKQGGFGPGRREYSQDDVWRGFSSPARCAVVATQPSEADAAVRPAVRRLPLRPEGRKQLMLARNQ
jgi:hypothetical protein